MILGKLANPKVEMNVDEINHVLITGTPLARQPKVAEVVKSLVKRYKKSKLVILSSDPNTVSSISGLTKYKVASTESDIKDVLEVVKGDVKNRILLGETENPILVVIDGLEDLQMADPNLIGSIKDLMSSPGMGMKLVLADTLIPELDLTSFNLQFKYQDLENFIVKIEDKQFNCK